MSRPDRQSSSARSEPGAPLVVLRRQGPREQALAAALPEPLAPLAGLDNSNSAVGTERSGTRLGSLPAPQQRAASASTTATVRAAVAQRRQQTWAFAIR